MKVHFDEEKVSIFFMYNEKKVIGPQFMPQCYKLYTKKSP